MTRLELVSVEYGPAKTCGGLEAFDNGCVIELSGLDVQFRILRFEVEKIRYITHHLMVVSG